MPSDAQNLLDPAVIQTAEALGLHARYVVEGYMAGEHKSPFRGFSIEFTQHREYVAGDDIRHLDWKVLGRTDRYYLKQYEQETNYVAHLLLDGSESMRYGSGVKGQGSGGAGKTVKPAGVTKFDYGKVMAACLAYLILHQRDAVSVSLFDTAVRQYLPRTGNLASLHGIMSTLSAFNPTRATGIGGVLHAAAGQIRRKGIVILISDLFDDEQAILDGIQHLRFGGNEVIVFHTMDPYELEFPFTGNVEFDGLEVSNKLLTRPREVRKSYLRELARFQDRLREGCERNSSHYVPVNTGHALHEVLSGYLGFRLRTTTR
jgi:uncharacterized protein (DUF58 family)